MKRLPMRKIREVLRQFSGSNLSPISVSGRFPKSVHGKTRIGVHDGPEYVVALARHELIGYPVLADTILDRLIHNAHRLPLKGESLSKKKGKSAPKS